MHASIRLLLPLLFFISQWAIAQTVVVTGAPGDDTNSSPRDEDGRIIGPETDNSFASFSAAVDFLMEYGNGGTVVINSFTGAYGYGVVTKPLKVIGTAGANLLNGSISAENVRIEVENVHFVDGGISISAGAELIVRDSIFDNSLNGILAGYDNVKIDAQNCEFQVQSKGIAMLASTADTLVKNCTFTAGYLGIDDRHFDGQSTYENIVFQGQDWIGLNIEQQGFGPMGTGTSTVTNCSFSNIGYQGFHLHNAKNVTATGLTATACGVLQAFFNDGAGIGGHQGGSNIVIEDSNSSSNLGAGFHFEVGIDGLTLRNNEARGNQNGGIRVNQAANITIEGGVLAGNSANNIGLNGGGIALSYVTNASISNIEIIENDTGGGCGGGIYAYDSNGTIQDVNIENNVADLDGGGIAIFNTPTNERFDIGGGECIIRANVSNQNGAGIYMESAVGTIDHCQITDNEAEGDGGGIMIVSAPDRTEVDDRSFIRRNTIESNHAKQNGGGISIADGSHSLIVIGDLGTTPTQLIRNNIAGKNGGGLYCEDSNPIIGLYPKGNPGAPAPNLFESNEASDGNGGGIFIKGAIGDRESLRIVAGNIFQKNKALSAQPIAEAETARTGNGGAIAIEESQNIDMGGDLIGDGAEEDGKGNIAQNNGGGCYFYRSTLSMGGSTGAFTRETIRGNEAQSGNGGGISIVQASDAPAAAAGELLSIINAIIQKNRATAAIPAGIGAYQSKVGNGGGVSITEKSNNVDLGGQRVGGGTIGSEPDPNFDPAQGNTANANGGGVYIRESNPMLNSLNIRANVSVEGSGGGVGVFSQDTALEPGKFRFCAIKANKALAQPPDGVGAINSLVGNGGGIAFYENADNFTMERCVIGQDDPIIEDAAKDFGNIAQNNGGGIFTYKSDPWIGVAADVADATNVFRKNQAVLGAGGGIAARDYSILAPEALTINRALFEENKALETNGGGIAFLDGADDMVVKQSILIKNWAGLHGGGIYVWKSSPILKDGVIIKENAAKTGMGGGIAVEDWNPNALDPMEIKGITVRANTSDTSSGGGIAIFDDANQVVIEEADIISNTAQNNGGGIYIYKSNPQIESPLGTTSYPLHGGKVVIQGNQALTGYGGGICCEDDSDNLGAGQPLLIRGAIVISNVAQQSSGGGIAFISNCSNAEMHFNLIGVNGDGKAAGNSALNLDGGGIFIEGCEPGIGGKRITGGIMAGAGIAFISFPGAPQNIISANKAKNGGGIALANGASPAIFGNDIGSFSDPTLRNTASRMGGGIYSDGGAPLIGPINPPPSKVSFFMNGGNYIIGNSAPNGGGVAFENGSIGELRWNIITQNLATGGVGATGGVYVTGAGTTPTITNNTIVLNQDDGIRVANGAQPLIQNLILHSNSGFGATVPGYKTIAEGGTFGSNDIYFNTGNYGPGTANLTQSKTVDFANIEIDPAFMDWIGQDYRLTADSPCTPGNSPPGSELIGALPGPIVEPPTDTVVVSEYRDADFGDIDGDGDIDLAFVTDSTDYIMWNAGNGVFGEPQAFNAPANGSDSSNAVELGDLDGDGDLDIVIANAGVDTLIINNNSEWENASDRLNSLGLSNNVKIADLNSDGNLDIIFAKNGANSLYIGDGAGNFTDNSTALGPDTNDTQDIGIADLDADGDLDLFCGNTAGDTVLLNDGSGTFQLGPVPPSPGNTQRVTLGDVDSDGDIDVFIAHSNGGALLLNQGNATFTDASAGVPDLGDNLQDVDFADLNSDGGLDVLIASPQERIAVWSDATVSKSTPQGASSYKQADAADIDGDGVLESVFVKNNGLEFVDTFQSLPVLSSVSRISPSQIAAGSIVTLTIDALTPSQRHVQVLFDGAPVPAYLINISQISFIVPADSTEGEHTVVIQTGAQRSVSTVIQIGDTTPVVTPLMTLDFNAGDFNNGLLQASGIDGYQTADVGTDQIPTGSDSDGVGLLVVADPGEGAVIFPNTDVDLGGVPAVLRVLCWATAPGAEVALVGLNSPVDGQLAYTNPIGDAVPVNRYEELVLIYDPPNGRVLPYLQVALQPGAASPVIVYFDRLIVEPLTQPLNSTGQIPLASPGDFESGTDGVMVNAIEVANHGNVTLNQEGGDTSLLLSIGQEHIAANASLFGEEIAYPNLVVGSANVRQQLGPGGTCMLVVTNFSEILGLFTFNDTIGTNETNLWIGGRFAASGPIPPLILLQNAGPNVDSVIEIDDLKIETASF